MIQRGMLVRSVTSVSENLENLLAPMMSTAEQDTSRCFDTRPPRSLLLTLMQLHAVKGQGVCRIPVLCPGARSAQSPLDEGDPYMV